jgi:hypothetical protein
VFTSRHAGALLATWALAPIGAAIILSAASLTPAQAAEIGVTSCVGGYSGGNCVSRWGPAADPYVREIPEPIDAAEKAHREARDHKWQARCHPVIEHDRLGVPRYRYSAPGCEFGIAED